MTDRLDDTQKHADSPAPATGDGSSSDPGPAALPDTRTAPAGPGSLPAAPPPIQAADSGWREPAWFPPRDKPRDRRPSTIAMVVGLVLIAVGIYAFLDRTLGVPMPRIQWSSLWPVILIVIGGLIVARSFQRKA